MLFKNKTCEKCQSKYDVASDTCPMCGEPNREFSTKQIGPDVPMLKPYRQIICFVVGAFGLSIISTVVAMFAQLFGITSESSYLMFTNGFSYLIAIIVLIAIISPQLDELFRKIKLRPSAWGFGALAGVALILSSLVYNNLIQYVTPVTDNANQSAIITIIADYPILSVVVLAFIGPICEEITYRLGLYSFLTRFKKWIAYLVTIVIFAFIHFDFTCFIEEDKAVIINELLNLPNYLIAGFILCFIYEKKGFAASTTAHIINNLYSVLMIIYGLSLGLYQ